MIYIIWQVPDDSDELLDAGWIFIKVLLVMAFCTVLHVHKVFQH